MAILYEYWREQIRGEIVDDWAEGSEGRPDSVEPEDLSTL